MTPNDCGLGDKEWTTTQFDLHIPQLDCISNNYSLTWKSLLMDLWHLHSQKGFDPYWMKDWTVKS